MVEERVTKAYCPRCKEFTEHKLVKVGFRWRWECQKCGKVHI